MSLRIDFLNHSSFLLDNGRTSLLVDPWLTGSAFGGAWELEWENPRALEDAARADYVWISHPHSDHMHLETLRQLLAKNPRLALLGNSNPIVDLNVILAALPFVRRVPVPERTEVTLDADTTVLVVPSLAIDSILAYRTGDLFVLDVNDAVLDPDLLRSILDRSPRFRGRVPDVLSLNFSHANKVLESEVGRVCDYYRARLKRFIEAFRPRLCLPVCSFQRYTGELARWQNDARVLPEDLAGLDPCVRLLMPGDSATVTKDAWDLTIREHARSTPSARPPRPSRSLADLEAAFATYAERCRREFLTSALLPPPIAVRLRDLDQTVRLDFKRGVLRPVEPGARWDLECHTASLAAALSKPYGVDALYVGADYSVADDRAAERKVKELIFKGCLLDYSITPRGVLGSVLSRARWRYALNRREQARRIVTRGHAMGGA